jgi:hypothetical protein
VNAIAAPVAGTQKIVVLVLVPKSRAPLTRMAVAVAWYPAADWPAPRPLQEGGELAASPSVPIVTV